MHYKIYNKSMFVCLLIHTQTHLYNVLIKLVFKQYALIFREEILDKLWENLLEKLSSCRKMLSNTHDLMALFTEMDNCLATLAEIEVRSQAIYIVR